MIWPLKLIVWSSAIFVVALEATLLWFLLRLLLQEIRDALATLRGKEPG